MKTRRRRKPEVSSREDTIPATGVEVSDEARSMILLRRVREARRFRVVAARKDINEFVAFVGRDDETKEPLVQGEIHETFQALADAFPRLIVMAFPESGKAIPVTTWIPTPGGFRQMGDLCVGDEVFDRSGQPCRVTFATPVQWDRDVYAVKFDDGDIVEADSDHRWIVKYANDRVWAKGKLRVVTTATMRDRIRVSDRYAWAVPVAGPVAYSPRDLPIDPYVLGVWLGDGTSANSSITFHEKDRFVWERCRDREGSAPPASYRPGVWHATLGPRSLKRRLRDLDLLGNKLIPEEYLTAGIEQRRELAAGLLDTDGYAAGKGRVEFTSCSEVLAWDAAELFRSLGHKVSVSSGSATLNGRVVGTKWRVCFTTGDQVFRLPRKVADHSKGSDRVGELTRWRSVVSIEPVPSVPVRCIAVDSADNSYLMGRSYTTTHNTNQLAVLRALFTLGHNPNARIAVLSKNEENAQKITRAIRGYIEKSQELAEVFPNLLPGEKWEEGFFTVRRPVVSKDPSVQALGLNSAIIGSRIDLLILDDILDLENTTTPAERKKTTRRIRAGFLDRVTKRGRIIFLTNAWHPEDAAHTFEGEADTVWHVARFPVVDEEGAPTWPEQWPEERIAEKRREMGPLEFARAFLCKARDDGESPFSAEAMDAAVAAARDLDLVYRVDPTTLPPGALIVTGVDLAVTKGTGSHLTALVTILVWPEDLSRQLLWVEAGRWGSGEIRTRVLDHDRRYGSIFIVENNAAQRWILDIIRNQADLPEAERRLPTLVPFTTGRNKAHPQFGVEGLAVEIETGDWLFPSSGPAVAVQEAAELRGEMLYYTRGAHTGDRLMAAWFAREGARRRGRLSENDTPGGDGGVKVYEDGGGINILGGLQG